MKFRNPWIDPWIVRVRLADVQAYLTQHGRKFVGPATNPNLLRHERVEESESASTCLSRRCPRTKALHWSGSR